MEERLFIRYVRQFRDMVFRVAYSYIKNAADAEDIMQEVFLKLYRSNETFEKDENVKSWLIRVTINASKDYLKSAWMSKRTALEDNYAIHPIKDSELAEAMNSLKSKYRIVIYLHYYEGYAVKEIAGLLGISESNVKTRLKRGRDMLKNIIKDEIG